MDGAKQAGRMDLLIADDDDDSDDDGLDQWATVLYQLYNIYTAKIQEINGQEW